MVEVRISPPSDGAQPDDPAPGQPAPAPPLQSMLHSPSFNAPAMPFLGTTFVPELSPGDAAGGLPGSRRRQELTPGLAAVSSWLESLFPFVLLLTAVFLYEHSRGILVFIWLTVCLSQANKVPPRSAPAPVSLHLPLPPAAAAPPCRARGPTRAAGAGNAAAGGAQGAAHGARAVRARPLPRRAERRRLPPPRCTPPYKLDASRPAPRTNRTRYASRRTLAHPLCVLGGRAPPSAPSHRAPRQAAGICGAPSSSFPSPPRPAPPPPPAPQRAGASATVPARVGARASNRARARR
jgi:hypothetical protein